MNQREAFETWYAEHCKPGVGNWFVRDESCQDQYYMTHTQTAWDAWQAATANKWQPIDTAPNDGTDVVVCLANNRPPIVAGYFKETNEWLAYDEPMNPVFPTHWMPLPPAP